MGDCFNECVNRNPKACTACYAILGLIFVIMGIAIMSGDGNYCSDTSDDYYYDCDDSDSEYLCGAYGCDECLWLEKIGSGGGCADYNGDPVAGGAVCLAFGIFFLLIAGCFSRKIPGCGNTPIATTTNNATATHQQTTSTSVAGNNNTVTMNATPNPNMNANNGLPPGWIQLTTEDGKIFYQNNNTKQTQWERPTMGAMPMVQQYPVSTPQQVQYVVQQPQQPQQPVVTASEGGAGGQLPSYDQATSTLPPGWEERRTEDGRVYYQNNNNQTTSWDRPTM